jgi:hypothetical protein
MCTYASRLNDIHHRKPMIILSPMFANIYGLSNTIDDVNTVAEAAVDGSMEAQSRRDCRRY